ncbi:unnamed protein product [Brassica oleracea var. botrytis]
MASSDVVLAHSAFDALPLGRSAQIIVDTGRQALGPQAKKPKPNQLSIYKLHQILTYCATHNDMCAAHPIHLYLSTPESNAWLMLGGREQGGTKKTIHYLENSFDSALTS